MQQPAKQMTSSHFPISSHRLRSAASASSAFSLSFLTGDSADRRDATRESPHRSLTSPPCRVARMYIRVKRNKSTYFIQCEPTETAFNIKQKLHSLIDQPPGNQQLILLATSDVLEDSKTLADQKVENDTVVALALRKDDNEFEEVFIARPEDFMSLS